MIDPIAFRIGDFTVHWYGIIIAAAVLAAGWVGGNEARRRGEDPDVGWGMLLPVLILAVIGARLYHVIHQWGFYSQHLDLIPQIWTGGLGIPGAVAGGVLAIWLYTRWSKLNTLRWLDIFASAMLLGQAIGRLGNFVNQELYGPPTTLPWGIPIDAEHRIGEWVNLVQFPDTTRFHPLFAYEALLNLVGFFFILWLGRRMAHRLYDGDILLIYLMWYSAVRIWLETFRVQNWVVYGVPMAILLGVITFVAAGGFLWLRHRNGWGVPGAWIAEKQARETSPESPAATTEPSSG
ncbi:MAG TPA: prolipoprotein diacylglyceryl transferase [Candidatus Limnocylindria bacterium]|nr:prolipoprotein diacylglyceryl transferase [Candidatus Limnocylindria bacterium]